MTILQSSIHSKCALEQKDYWRVKELALYFDVTPKTIWTWIKTNPDFPKVALKPSRKCSLIRNSDLQRYLTLKESECGEARCA